MRIFKKDYSSGEVIVLPQTLEDLWYLNKVVAEEDLVSGTTSRKFESEGGNVERKKVYVKLEVDKTEFHEYSNNLRVLGTIKEARPEKYCPTGVHHTINFSAGDKIKIFKEKWTQRDKDLLTEAVEASKQPKLVIAAMDDEETQIALLRPYGLDRTTTIRSGKSGKMYGSKDWQPNYFQDVADVLSRFDTKKVVVGGPGFTKNNFKEYCKGDYPEVFEKLVFQDTGSAGSTGIQEVLKKERVGEILENAKIARETKLVEKFLKQVGKENLAAYGKDEVEKAIEYGAVKTLLLSEKWFNKNREEAEEMMDRVRGNGGESHVISGEHESGKKLENFGVCALLRFKT